MLSKKLAISGTTGILVACLTIIAIVTPPWSDLISAPVSSLNGTCPLAPLQVNMSIAIFQPSKLGGEANLTVTVTHYRWDSPDTYVEIFPHERTLPEDENKGGIIFISGEKKWQGYLNANVPVVFDLKIKANKIGNWTLEAHAMSMFGYHLWYEERKIFGISVTGDNITIVPDGFWPIHPPESIGLEMHVSNFTEPQGIGSEAEVTVIMTAHENISNVTAQIDWSRGFEFVSGNPIWSGDLSANVPVSFKVRIRVKEVGRWSIFAKAEKPDPIYSAEPFPYSVEPYLRLIKSTKSVFIIAFADRIVLSETEQIVY